jgi:arylsulfatase A-like enzyme
LRRRRARLRWVCAAVAALTGTAVLAGCSSAAHSTTAGPPVAPAHPDPRPNIVFVLTDDVSTNLMQYMPHVAAMEQEGTSFSNHYVVDSLCCPSRAAIFTGQYPHDDGVFTNGGADGGYSAYTRDGDAAKSFAISLQRAGYRTALMGKYLNEYLPQIDPPAPGWDVWDVSGYAYPEYNYSLNENGTVQHYGHAPADYLTDVLSQKATSFIDSSAAQGKPFALEVATFAAHHPFTPGPQDEDSFPTVTAPRSPAFGVKPTAPANWLEKVPPLAPRDVRHIDDAFRLRVEAMQAVDRTIGQLQRVLVAKGLAQNTYFVFTSDNGFHMGEYGLRPGKQTAFDTDIKVPLIVTGPNVPPAATVSAFTSSIDFAPTFEQIAGITPAADTDGVSMLPLWQGQPPPPDWQQGILVEHHGPDFLPGDPDRQTARAGNPPSYEAVRTADALYVEYYDGDREYYDLAKDPYELHNLAAVAPPSTLAPLRDMLHALENCHGSTSCQAAARLGPVGGSAGRNLGLPR